MSECDNFLFKTWNNILFDMHYDYSLIIMEIIKWTTEIGNVFFDAERCGLKPNVCPVSKIDWTDSISRFLGLESVG